MLHCGQDQYELCFIATIAWLSMLAIGQFWLVNYINQMFISFEETSSYCSVKFFIGHHLGSTLSKN